MKKYFFMFLFVGSVFAFNNQVEAGCDRSVGCGAGSLSCSGGSCTGSRPTESNPWVECDGARSYCYPPAMP